jgi:flagellar biosynthesis protein FlhB
MAEPESRSEEPTEHRLAEARRRGVIPGCRELQTALTALAIALALVLGGRAALGSLLSYLRDSLSHACVRGDLGGAGRASLQVLKDVLAIPLGVAMAVGLVGGAILTRGHFSAYAFRFDLGRVLPSSRRRRGAEAGTEIVKALGKASIVMALAWWTMQPNLAGLVHLGGAPAGKMLTALINLAEALGLRLGLAAVALGVADHFWQWYRHRRSLRMSHDEVKREQKEREGDPRLRSARERWRAEFLQRLPIEEVRRASLLVMDGENKAVALRYDPGDSRAPVVVYKGEQILATKMVQIAREFDVPICHDQALTADLASVDEGDEIPEASHEAVAGWLAARD